MTIYKITGLYVWTETISNSQRLNVEIEADSDEDDALAGAIEQHIIWRDGEFLEDDTAFLAVEPLEDVDEDERERRENFQMMQALGVPTLFELEEANQ